MSIAPLPAWVCRANAEESRRGTLDKKITNEAEEA